jgi:hypothetical protein
MIDLNCFHQVAVRAWAVRPTTKRRRRRRDRPVPPIHHVLVIDTETTVDNAQALLFGVYRYCRVDATTVTTVAEGLIAADDLPKRDPAGYAALRAYVLSHKADVDLTYLAVEPNWDLGLVSRSEFVKQWVWHVGYPHNNRLDPATIVMFNAPFDLSRLAVDAAEARSDMYGGFSFTMWQDAEGKAESWRPRLAIKSLDSKRAIKKFRRLERGAHDHAGHLLDLRTLVFALTGASHSLNSACAAFEVPGKLNTPEFGIINESTIDYCRQDVAATTGLLEAALVEHGRHPVQLQTTVAYSPASVAKAYLRGMGVISRLTAQPDFDPTVLGYAMSAFYGGRAEVHIRHTPIPVAVVDFTSMYPTVDALLGLWGHVTADSITTVEVTEEVNRLLGSITLEDCFNPALWLGMVVIAQVVPDGDVLPVRADYREEQWSIGVNPLHAEVPLWYTLPDLIASVLLTGKAPTITQALRFVPVGQQPDLQPVQLRGDVSVNPAAEDFFRAVVQARQRAKHDGDRDLAAFLKVLANSGSYGIYAEMIRHELPTGNPEKVTVHGPNTQSFEAKVTAPEELGEFCFPPIAAAITGAARLMLTLLERAVTDAGGTWVFCDTDSLAIAATENGGLVPCNGGEHRLPDGSPAVRTLSYAQVDAIRERFTALNPYDPVVVPEVLKLEQTGTCYAISAKRYVIYQTDPDGTRTIVKRSLHGLGRYLDPLSPDTDRRDKEANPRWIDDSWHWILDVHNASDAALPEWADRPALSRITVSSPPLLRPFTRWNTGRPWAEQITPFNFLLIATCDPFGHPPEVDPARFLLIAPYDNHPERWTGLDWRDRYDPDGPSYRITTDRNAPPAAHLAGVQSYADVLHQYRMHPEHKFNGPDGQPCRRNTAGVLQRRAVHLAGMPRLIGKEANNLDDVLNGLITNLDDVLNQYNDPLSDDFHRLVMPVLDRYSGRELAKLVGTDRRTIDRIRDGQRPRATLGARLTQFAETVALTDLVNVDSANGTGCI